MSSPIKGHKKNLHIVRRFFVTPADEISKQELEELKLLAALKKLVSPKRG